MLSLCFMQQMPSGQAPLNTTGDLYENQCSATQNMYRNEYEQCALVDKLAIFCCAAYPS